MKMTGEIMSNKALDIVKKLISEGVSRGAIGKSIGYSRTAVSLFADCKYQPVEKIEAAILFRYERVSCPHLKRDLTPSECQGFANRPCPTSTPREVRHWKACRSCEHRPNGGEA